MRQVRQKHAGLWGLLIYNRHVHLYSTIVKFNSHATARRYSNESFDRQLFVHLLPRKPILDATGAEPP